jgi:hypothetical protein
MQGTRLGIEDGTMGQEVQVARVEEEKVKVSKVGVSFSFSFEIEKEEFLCLLS